MTFWLVETFAAVSLLMLAVLILRRPVARLFGAGWAYALWLVPALRLVLPPLPSFSETLSPVVLFIPTTGGGTAPLPAETGSGLWMPFLLAIWAGGAVIFLGFQWLAYRAFLRRLDGSSRPARPPLYGGIATFVSEAVDGPLALGLTRRRIVIPADFVRRYSEAERRLALEHELTHHRRGDLWWNVAAILVLAAHWFNPLAWAAFRAFRTDQELACDAAVAAKASAEERHDYALALVKSASRPGLIAACSLNNAAALKRRLRMMRCHRASRRRSAGGLAVVGALALVGFSLASAQPRVPNIVYVAKTPASTASKPPAPIAPPAAQAAASRPAAAPSAAPVRRAAVPPPERPELSPDSTELELEASPVEPAPLDAAALSRAAPMRSRFVIIRAPTDFPDGERMRAALGEALARADAPEGARPAQGEPVVERRWIVIRTEASRERD